MSSLEKIRIELSNGDEAELIIVADNPNSIQKIEESEASENLEAPIQLKEGVTYEYQITNGYTLEEDNQGIVSESKINKSTGRITPNIYVGTLHLDVLDSEKEKRGKVELEVQSTKTDYRTEYRFMLEEITQKCTDLLMQYSSPANQSFDIAHDKDQKTLYQRFAFLKSVLDSEEFWTAIHRVTTNPVTEWMQTEELRDIRSVRKMNRNVVRQLAGSSNRVALDKNHTLSRHMKSVPEKVTTRAKVDTVNTPENRFIKFALESFKNICSDFKSAAKPESRLNKEAESMEEKIEEALSHALFHKISQPSTLPLNSPVLQRKEGYREILRVWLMVNLAARLTWRGGEDVYKGGKRDVATLYEYWLFFKLIELLEDLFGIKAMNPDDLIEETNDKLGLKLRQGKYLPLVGTFETETRKLHVQFSFNKTFSGENKYPQGGSWTRSMRPDYTLSIWPEGFDEEQAEEQELIVHLHFDAKYKVDNLSNLFGTDDENLDEEKKQQSKGTYNRADLLKMHSYRDSIRRTAGAYILYPGGEGKKEWRGFHEILPGLGAFTLKPNIQNDGSEELKAFLKDVIKHFLNRTSQREKLASRVNKIHSEKTPYRFEGDIPEYLDDEKLIPDEVFVVVGYFNDEEHHSWIKERQLYNIRYGTGRGGVKLTHRTVTASYLLLWGPDGKISGEIYKLKNTGPVIYSSSELKDVGYPRAQKEYNYLVYEIESVAKSEFKNRNWDIRKVHSYEEGRFTSARPMFVSLSELMRAEI